jgi:hypothetical protein
MSRAKRTAKDFPQEYLAAWQLAVEGKLMLTMESVGMARNMIQQLYIFRKRLMEESPQIAGAFYTVDLRVHDELGNVITGKPTKVPQKAIIKPFVSTWKDQIRTQMQASGSGVSASPVVPIVEPTVPDLPICPPSQGQTDSLTETLSDLGYSTEKPN